MKRIIIVFCLTLLLSGCFLEGDGVKEASENVKNTVDQTVAQGRQAAEILHENAIETKAQIEDKIAQADLAAQKIAEAHEALSRLFGRESADLKDIDLCKSDADCIIVEYKGCCSKQKAINKTFEEVYNAVPRLHTDGIDCNMVQCVETAFYQNTVCKFDNKGAQRCSLTNR